MQTFAVRRIYCEACARSRTSTGAGSISLRWNSTEAYYRKALRDSQRDFILSVLEAQPSARDSRFYLKAFAAPPAQVNPVKATKKAKSAEKEKQDSQHLAQTVPKELRPETKVESSIAESETLVESLLNPITQHTGLVKLQGPFTDRQLASVCNGMIYLRRLGLISILVVDLDGWSPEQPNARERMRAEVTRIADMLEEQGGMARPILGPLLKKKNGKAAEYELDNAANLYSAISQGEIPVLAPICFETENRSICISANDCMRGLAIGLQEAQAAHAPATSSLDLTPLRIMVINREGAIPSHARGGTPHLSINLESEYDFIVKTFEWQDTHPTALENMRMMRDCLAILPRTSSAVIVSHRSPRSLVANLVTNKPAHSPSLHRSAFPAHVKLEHTPTILRHGLPIKVHRSLANVDLAALTKLLETSFGRTLDAEAYWARLEATLDFIIVAGKCDAVAIVTKEGPNKEVSYLDKFAVLPSLQGDGTVDFMWGALRDETFGLGLLDALNNNGGLEGRGKGVDLVWRSRANNPVNKWYFERSNGFVKLEEMGKGGMPGLLFWCDAEKRIEEYQKKDSEKFQFVAEEEHERLSNWNKVIGQIASAWKA